MFITGKLVDYISNYSVILSVKIVALDKLMVRLPIASGMSCIRRRGAQETWSYMCCCCAERQIQFNGSRLVGITKLQLDCGGRGMHTWVAQVRCELSRLLPHSCLLPAALQFSSFNPGLSLSKHDGSLGVHVVHILSKGSLMVIWRACSLRRSEAPFFLINRGETKCAWA